jgi:YVTN family beta-propeller protein
MVFRRCGIPEHSVRFTLPWSACLLFGLVGPASAQTVYASTGRAILAIDGRTDVSSGRGAYAGLGTLHDLAMAAGGSRLEIVSHEIEGSDRILDYDATSLTPIGYTDIRGPLHILVPAPDGKFMYAISEHRISVVDVLAHAVVKFIPQDIGPAEASLSPDGRMLYISQVFGRSVLVVDTRALRVIDTIAVGRSLGGIAISGDGAHAYVADQDGNALVFLNTATRKVEKTIPLPGGPAAVVVTPDGRTAYVALSEPDPDAAGAAGRLDGAISVVDLRNARVVRSIPMAGRNLDLAVSSDGAKLYVGSDRAGTVAVIDTKSNILLHTVKLDAPGVFALVATGPSPRSKQRFIK